jgi:hypothetical protein
MEPSLDGEILYEEYKEGNLDGLPDVEVSYEVRVLCDGEEVFIHDYPSDEFMTEDVASRDRAVISYRQQLLADQFGETD